jgi:hypothetical protein
MASDEALTGLHSSPFSFFSFEPGFDLWWGDCPMILEKKTVIYNRYSSDMQNPRSCGDQERDIRTDLPRFRVDPTNAIVIQDEAQSGTKSDRKGFARLKAMMEREEIGVLAVDDLSRLTRGENAFAFVKDLKFSGGRFISTTESIDTDVPGWEMNVQFREIKNSQDLIGLKDKVLRGQRGRVLADESAGDYGYGYESYYLDADWEQRLGRRGPAPAKGIRICDIEAYWVKKIFAWYNAGLSLQRIVDNLVREGAPKNSRAGAAGFSKEQVRRILRNKKYIGIWEWGWTTGLSNSEGQKKRIAVTKGEVIVRIRPELRIVGQGEWDLAQERNARQKVKYAHTGTATKGPKWPKNPAAVHPRTLLGGFMTCALCAAPMWLRHSGNQRHYYCSSSVKGNCSARFVVAAGRADETVISTLTGFVTDWPEWICDVHRRLLTLLEERAAQQPAERENDLRRLAELKKQIGNFILAIANGGAMSTALAASLQTAEREAAEIESRLAAIAQIDDCSTEMPEEQWVKDQLQQWSRRLADSETAAIAIREALASLTAEAIVPPGKKRGFVKLKLRVNSWGMLMAAIGTKLPMPLRSLLPDSVDGEASPMIELILGGPTAIDKWMPDIVRWRKENVTWEAISSRTGLRVSNLFIAWKRYGDAYQS